MTRAKPIETSREGIGSSPPRFASEALSDSWSPHQVELAVQRELLAQPKLHFASLVVRRINNGVCLQGVLESDPDSPDVCSIAQRITGVREVLNHLVIAASRLPAKG
jgi:osmotically-inducible protein OsmY